MSYVTLKKDYIVLDFKSYHGTKKIHVNIVYSDVDCILIDVGHSVVEVKRVERYNKLIICNLEKGYTFSCEVNHWDIIIQNCYFSQVYFNSDTYFERPLVQVNYHIHDSYISTISLCHHINSLNITHSNIFRLTSSYQIKTMKTSYSIFNQTYLCYIEYLKSSKVTFNTNSMIGFASKVTGKMNPMNDIVFHDKILMYFLGIDL